MTPEAREQFDSVPKPIQGRIMTIAIRLEKWPDVSGAKPLRKGLAGNFRIRTGDYRLIFRFNQATDTVTIWKIGYRGGMYD
jgi:mRNA-degrading endonuclease RelE of RelBE toxin-antitoxin system